jgi:elongation factor P
MLGFNDIRKGKIVELDGQPYVVQSAEFLRKQQRRPVMRTILKHLQTGATREHSFQQSDKVAEADVDRIDTQYLYREGENYVFMQQATYEQFTIPPALVSDAAPYLLESQAASLILFRGKPVVVELPIKIDRTVVEAPPGVRGDTSKNVMQEVTVEGGARIKAPLFVKEGDKIRIDTRTGTYVERA